MIKVSLTSKSVRHVCINNNWYTCGDNKSYENMLEYVSAVFGIYGDTFVSLTTAEKAIIKIADNIMRHSDVNTMMEVSCCSASEIRENIIFILLNKVAIYRIVD